MKSSCAKLFVASLLMLALNGCSSFGDDRYEVGDAMSADFRTLARAKPTNLAKLCKDFEYNNINAKGTWESNMLVIHALVTKVSKTKSQFVLSFHDLAKNPHSGRAYTKDNLIVSEKNISALKKGDHAKIYGTLNTDKSNIRPRKCSFSFEKVRFEPLEVKKKQ